jgi:chloramphenicol-sensitive protein RarD
VADTPDFSQTPENTRDADAHAHRRMVLGGLGFGALAYGSWGFVAYYFRAVAEVNPFEVLAHRVIWSVGILALLVTLRRQWGTCRELLGSAGTWRALSFSTVLIAVNWLVFIYAVASGRLVEASLGYFINPLVSILLGMVFLGERLRPLQWVAVALAIAGVAVYTTRVGTLPWISLTLASSFGLYGLVRKQSKAGPIVGLFFETGLLLPFAVGYLLVLGATGGLVFATRPPPGAEGLGSLRMDLLLCAGGVVTTLPLLWFAAAARRLRLSTIGFMQYSAPTIQFLIAVLDFGEPFDRARAFAFAIIWVGIAVFVTDSAVRTVREGRARRKGRTLNGGAAQPVTMPE